MEIPSLLKFSRFWSPQWKVRCFEYWLQINDYSVNLKKIAFLMTFLQLTNSQRRMINRCYFPILNMHFFHNYEMTLVFMPSNY